MSTETKKERDKAYEAGQAAQLFDEPDDACPFEEGTPERDAYMRGKSEELAPKWLRGRRRGR